jgi:hypothetical protein
MNFRKYVTMIRYLSSSDKNILLRRYVFNFHLPKKYSYKSYKR